jgi:ribonucleotide reductase alpha subunit
VVPWVKQYDYAASAVSQGGVRRGAFAFYLDLEHPDALELLNAKDHLQGDPRNMIDSNIAFVIRDETIDKINKGDPKVKLVFDKALEMSLKVGSPYFMFVDNVNRQNPEAYNIHNLKVSTSNLCLTGDTLVATKEGAQPIKDLVGKEVTIFDGKDWIKNNKFFYQGKSEVLEVTLANGQVIKMTPDHRCLLWNKTEVAAKDLCKGDELYVVHSLLNSSVSQGFTVSEINFIEQPQDVYCTKVDTTNYFALANGILTGNCSEITLYTDDLHSAICCLSSLNLAKWFEWKDWVGTSGKTVPELAVYFLDAVMSSFIKDASKDEDLANAVRSAVKGRPLG